MLKMLCRIFLVSLLLFHPSIYAIDVISKAHAAPPAWKGQGKGHGKARALGKGHGRGHTMSKARGRGKAKFAAGDRQAITKYFSATPFPVTTLPPGIAMNLQRGKPLPPGIQKVFLPSGLTSQLPNRPGYEYIAAGNDVVLVNSRTNVVTDVLTDVLR